MMAFSSPHNLSKAFKYIQSIIKDICYFIKCSKSNWLKNNRKTVFMLSWP